MDSDKLKIAFGKVLFNLRSEMGVSQQEVADHCDIERAYISRLERGLQLPSLIIVFKIASYFQLSPSELIERLVTQTRKTR